MKRSWPLILPALFGLWTAYLLAQTRPGVSRRPPPRTVDPRPPSAAEPVTFNKQVVRILQDNCQKCHHDGGIAPFALTTYADAFAKRARSPSPCPGASCRRGTRGPDAPITATTLPYRRRTSRP